MTANQRRSAGGLKLWVNREVQFEIYRLLRKIHRCNWDRAVKLAETSFIQVLVSNETPDEPDVAYDLNSFEIHSSCFFSAAYINLEPIIQRLKGMILLQRESGGARHYKKELRESVKETVQEQSEFINELQKARKVFKSPEDLKTALVDELNKISRRH